jgi:hypothetical protein
VRNTKSRRRISIRDDFDKDFGTGIRDLAKRIGLGCGLEIRWEKLETTSQRQETSLDGGNIDRIFKDSEQDTLEYMTNEEYSDYFSVLCIYIWRIVWGRIK